MSTKPEMHPDMRDLVADLEKLPAWESLEEQREIWTRFCISINRPPPPSITTEERVIAGAAAPVPVRIYRPAGRPGTLPCVIYLHGGGWVLGNPDTQDTITWGLAQGAAAVVLSVDYRLAPEHPYPAAFDDCCAVLEHVAANPAEFDVDAARIALCGDSAGGNLAAAVCLAARDRGGPAVAAQALVYPVLDTDMDRPSYRENAETPMLGREEMMHFLEAYLGPRTTNPDAYAMPLRAADFTRLPPALVHTAELDPLRDEGRLYARRLAAAGTSVEYRCARGMLHSFMRARLAGPGVAAEFDFICGFLRRKLGK